MKILVIADVHNRIRVSKKRRNKTIKVIENVIKNTDCDLIVFPGDIVHGPDFQGKEARYEPCLREVLDLTGDVPFAAVFGNHDDECDITKEQLLAIQKSYPNCLTQGGDYVLRMAGETLLFLDSGSYYDGAGSYYDFVRQPQIDFALSEIADAKAILFQHIIVPEILRTVSVEKKRWKKQASFYPDVRFEGRLGECPCPPDINGGEWAQLAPHLKAAVFAHDHKNDFELTLDGVRVIQCAGAGYNAYEYPQTPRVKLLDTVTLTTQRLLLR